MSSTELHPTISGEAVTIRPIRLTDLQMESEFIHRLLPGTKNFRFLGGVNALPPSELAQLGDIDGKHSMAFVATVRREGEILKSASAATHRIRGRTFVRLLSPSQTNGNARAWAPC